VDRSFGVALPIYKRGKVRAVAHCNAAVDGAK
jgi:hypothetical protein